jgi:hypothetical protein
VITRNGRFGSAMMEDDEGISGTRALTPSIDVANDGITTPNTSGDGTTATDAEARRPKTRTA